MSSADAWSHYWASGQTVSLHGAGQADVLEAHWRTFFAQLPEGASTSHSGANSIDVDAIAAQTSPMGRAGTPGEVADLIVFLASDASSYISGQEMVIDGAMTAR